MIKLKYLLILLIPLVSFVWFKPIQSHYNQINISEKPNKAYKGYGSKTIALLNKFDISDIQKAIILAEHGATIPSNNNVGNLRYSDGYKSYSTLAEGIKAQKVLLIGGWVKGKYVKGKYVHCFTNNPLKTIQAIQDEGYCPDKEWVPRVYAWYCVLQGDNSKLNSL
jgi:hypothetical protein